jgi:deoxyribonuclease V
MSNASPLSINQARQIQLELAKQVQYSELPSRIKTIAGFDIAYIKSKNTLIAGMVVLEYPSLTPIACKLISGNITFPYIPGYLSFREAPALLDLIKRFGEPVDIFVIDGHGLAHPRGLGIASHIGVVAGKPTIGCAKKILVGKYDEPPDHKGGVSDIVYHDRVVGCAVRTKDHTKPVFISVGHLTDLSQNVDLILSCATRYRIPEPTRLAHLEVTRRRHEIQAERD